MISNLYNLDVGCQTKSNCQTIEDGRLATKLNSPIFRAVKNKAGH